ncbi:MAG: glycosyltransferase [Phycisphaerae bacterium]|nr:glycosyltransferase [Phycisphaerae bacterium]
MRVALVHDWLTGMRGGEKVLSVLCRLLPDADLFTLIHTPGACDRSIERMRIITSCLNDLPWVERYYRCLLPVMPLAVESLDLEGYDLIISSSHCVAKGIIRPPESLHVCYCHTPMRYAWSQAEQYHQTMGLLGLALRAVRGYLRAWDRRSAGHVDCFIANSHNVGRRILRSYGRHSEVVYPPVDTDLFSPGRKPREDFYLMVTAMAPYKRVDQAVLAFSRLGRRLVIIGRGQQSRQLMKNATENISFLGWQSDEVVRDHYRRCRALIFPGEEDFGMVPAEAMACGAPVISYRGGGAGETVLDVDAPDPNGPTGLLYGPQTPEALAAAVKRFEQVEHCFAPRHAANWARRFSGRTFTEGIKRVVGPMLRRRGLGQPWSNDTTDSH